MLSKYYVQKLFKSLKSSKKWLKTYENRQNFFQSARIPADSAYRQSKLSECQKYPKYVPIFFFYFQVSLTNLIVKKIKTTTKFLGIFFWKEEVWKLWVQSVRLILKFEKGKIIVSDNILIFILRKRKETYYL